MAAASDKARFFLEQSIPELKEFERKKIFSAEEITSIARKRSDFEHKINARGATAADYARYAEFEINVDALRKRRVKRLGVKASAHEGQRRIFSIFDRGTRKHPGDINLHMQSIEYARRQKAYKKLSQIFANVLRFHPTKPDLWIYAAKFSFEENGDMTEARSYMQRGLRFCKNSRKLWLEYARLEMSYVAKLRARRRILGIADDTLEANEIGAQGDEEVSAVNLPGLTVQPANSQVVADPNSDLPVHPVKIRQVMNGAIAITIYDTAIEHFKEDVELDYDFFNMFYEQEDLNTLSETLEHIIKNFEAKGSLDWRYYACYIRMPLFAISTSSPSYPAALRQSLHRLKDGISRTSQNPELTEWTRHWVQSLLNHEGLDMALHKVLVSVEQSLEDH